MDDLQIRRRALWAPCRTPDEAKAWIRAFCGLDLPDRVVYRKGPVPSNCTPFDLVWRVYEGCMTGKMDGLESIMAIASRDSGKTLAVSILELMVLLHDDRDVFHLAAIKKQSQRARGYAGKFIEQSRWIRPYLTGGKNNDTEIVLVSYDSPDGEHLTEPEWKALSPAMQDRYEKVARKFEILVCTMQATNGPHSGFVVTDEVDVIVDPRAFQQAKAIPSVTTKGKDPVFLRISTRKFATGLVQKELDEADESGMTVWNWNVYDCAHPCPPARHRGAPSEAGPALERVRAHFSEETLEVLSDERWSRLPEEDRIRYQTDEDVRAGCLKNCQLYASCRGQLAEIEPVLHPSAILRTPKFIQQNRVKAFGTDMAIAEAFCWRPGRSDLIYPRFSRALHVLSPRQIWEEFVDEPTPDEVTREMVVDRLLQHGEVVAGLDWGFTHAFAVPVGVRLGNRMVIVACWSVQGLDSAQKADFLAPRLEPLGGREKIPIWPDPESPDSIKLFRRLGFRMRKWKKAQGSVMSGIEDVRFNLNPPLEERPRLVFLGEDDGIDLLTLRMERYAWRKDLSGQVIDGEPDDKEDDEVTALRYLVMNTLQRSGGFKDPGETVVDQRPLSAQERQLIEQRAVLDQIPPERKVVPEFARDLLGRAGLSPPDGPDEQVGEEVAVQSGRFLFDLA